MIRPRRLALTPLLAATAVALLVGHPRAAAPGPPAPTRIVALEVIRDPDATVCPDEATLAANVTRRLGRDPFAASAPERVLVHLGGARRGFRARITLIGAPPFHGIRKLTSPDPACVELGETVALTIAVAIDPLVLVRPDPPPPRPGPIGVRRAADREEERPLIARLDPEPTPPEPPDMPVRGELGVYAVGGAALAPGITLGPRLGVAVVGDGWALGAAASLHLLGAGDVEQGGSGRVAAPIGAGELHGCLRFGPWSTCAVLAVGVQRFGGDGVTGAADALWVAPGLRLGGRLPLSPGIALAATVEGMFPVTRARARVSGETVWETPAAALALGLGVVFTVW